MKYSSLVLFGVALVVTGASTSACGSQRQASNTNHPVSTPTRNAQVPSTGQQYDFSNVDRLLQDAAPQLGGCALLLIRDGKVIYRKAFGQYSVDKVVPIASASKWLSGAVIMSQVDVGKLSLDDPVSKYLPEFSGDKTGITIRHLFAHTSGLPPEAPCRNDKRTTLERCANEIARLKLRTKPGEEFYYGGVSMHVGGRVAEIVSGKSWNDLFAEKVAAPLGLQIDYSAYGQTTNPRPAGDARSSIDDYGRFLQMILNHGSLDGHQILSAESVSEMHKDQTGEARIVYTIYMKHGDLHPMWPRTRYGIGMWREKVAETNGQILEASSQGALGFSPWIDTERNLVGVLSVQSSMSRVMPLYMSLKEEIRRVVPASGNASAWR